MRAALRRLPPAQREALVLAYWGGMTADEIARRSHVPLGTAKSRIRLGLAQLREECGAARPLECRAASHRSARAAPLSSNARSTAEPRHTMCARAGDPLPAPRRRPAGANPRLLPR